MIAVVDGEAGRARGRDGGEEKKGRRAVGAPGEREPGRRGQDQGRGAGGAGGRGEGLGRGDAEGERGGQEQERVGAGPQRPGTLAAGALWASRASITRRLRILTPRGMALSSGLKLGLCRGAAVASAGFLTPRKK